MITIRHTPWLASLSLLVLLCAGHIVPSVQDSDENKPAGGFFKRLNRILGRQTDSAPVAVVNASEPGDWESFKKSGYYVEPFEPELKTLPGVQLVFIRASTHRDLAMFKSIIHDAIENMNKFAANARILLKWGTRLISTFLDNRRNEIALTERVETKSAFFTMLADMVTQIIDISDQLKNQQGYSKKTVNKFQLENRTIDIFDYYERVTELSPVASYLRWDRARIYQDKPQHPAYNGDLKLEAADIMAQFRGIGYESAAFMARRIVNMLRVFGKGEIPQNDI